MGCWVADDGVAQRNWIGVMGWRRIWPWMRARVGKGELTREGRWSDTGQETATSCLLAWTCSSWGFDAWGTLKLAGKSTGGLGKEIRSILHCSSLNLPSFSVSVLTPKLITGFIQILHVNMEIGQRNDYRWNITLQRSCWAFFLILLRTCSKIGPNIAEIVGFILNLVLQPKPAIFGHKYLQILLLNIKIVQNKIFRGLIQLPSWCCALPLIRALTCSKTALNIVVYTESQLKISDSETCSSFISKIHYYTSKSPKIKVVYFIFISNFCFRHSC